jgi:hypothetical protein
MLELEVDAAEKPETRIVFDHKHPCPISAHTPDVMRCSRLYDLVVGDATLTALEQLAAEPLLLERADADALRVLQYRLHRASEDAFALDKELASALASARDATAEVVEALEDGDDDLASVYEWRGALFRVRLARLRLAPPREPKRDDSPPARRELRAPLLACLLVVAGAVAFTGGAVVGSWPLWVAGMLAVCGSFITFKP